MNAQRRMTEPWFRALDEIEGDDYPIVGGKAFQLALLHRNGLLTPPGLVVTTHFFIDHVTQLAYAPLWSGSPDVAVTENALLFLADTLKTRPLSREQTTSLQAALDRYFPPEIEFFAVRSSATDEDHRHHSFAGIHLTELGVPRSAITVSLTRCWASALAEPALRYRRSHGMSIQGIKIAVLIQAMLHPQVAGIGFTLNPTTGARDELLIEGSWGSGARVVSGQVNPSRYRLAKRPPHYPLIGREAGDIPPDRPANLLSDRQLRRMADGLLRIEALMGDPQDVEWAWQDDDFYILQTRPAQTMPAIDLPTIDTEWTRGNYRESLPELPSPLFASLLDRTHDRAISFFSQVNLNPHGVGPYIKTIYGRPYLNLTMLKRVTSQLGFAPNSILQAFGYAEPGPARTDSISIDWEVMWRARRAMWRLVKNGLQAEKQVERHERRVTTLAESLALPLPGADRPEAPVHLLAQFRLREDVYSDLLRVTLVLVGGIAGLGAIAARLLEPVSASAGDMANALASLGTQTLAPPQSQVLIELGQIARAETVAQNYFAGAADDFSDYRQALAGTEFLHQFDEMLSRDGFRALYEADMAWPRYRDDPTPLLQIIGRYTQMDTLASTGGPARDRQDATAPTWQRRPAIWRRLLAAPFINRLRKLLFLRERMRLAQAKAMAAIRRWDLALAQRWVEIGWLDSQEDYFWLKMEDIERTLVAGADAGVTLRPIINARRTTYQTYEAISPPNVLRDSDIPHLEQDSGQETKLSGRVLTGLPLSPGQVEGQVVVINRPEDFSQMKEEAILVVPSTDPAWFPLFPLARGLIVEMGGLLSHGSIIAREYGLAAVANIPDAMKCFQTGDRVLVDGSTGVVQIIEQV